MQHAIYGAAPVLIRVSTTEHDEETDMIGYRILILIAAILITGCEALVFVGTTAVN
jgi:phosphate starvation-inducible membrane PsiE